MIHILTSFATAVLSDGNIVIEEYVGPSSQPSWSEPILIEGEPIKICSSVDSPSARVIAVLTHDGRILTNCQPVRPEFRDVTLIARGLTGSDTTDIRDVRVCDCLLIFWTDFTLGFIGISPDPSNPFTFYYKLEAGIDQVWVGSCCCMVRTKDMRMFRVTNKLQYLSMLSALGTAVCPILDRKPGIVFHDIENIVQVHSDAGWILFHMKDGSVYGCDSNKIDANKPFSLVPFPEGETVTKIVNACTHIVYSTAAGNCYVRCLRAKTNWTIQPTLIES